MSQQTEQTEQTDIVIVGAGFAGIYMAYKARELGLSTVALERGGGVDVGLGASVWSADRSKAMEVASRIEAGTVWVNSHGGVNPMVPFGGAKQSGYGLEFGVEGLKALGLPQVINS